MPSDPITKSSQNQMASVNFTNGYVKYGTIQKVKTVINQRRRRLLHVGLIKCWRGVSLFTSIQLFGIGKYTVTAIDKINDAEGGFSKVLLLSKCILSKRGPRFCLVIGIDNRALIHSMFEYGQ